jgi:hypothetical protein
MALPNGTGGYQLGDGNLNEVVLGTQATPTTYTAAATLTIVDLENGLVIYNAAGANNLALPTAASVDAEITSAKVGSSFNFNLLCSGAGAGTITVGTGWTLVGSGAGVAGAGVGFRAVKTGDATWSLYRISN